MCVSVYRRKEVVQSVLESINYAGSLHDVRSMTIPAVNYSLREVLNYIQPAWLFV